MPGAPGRHCEDGSMMGTIGAVLTPQMPKQVWQADDGSVFDSEEACRKHEEADLLLRDLFDSQTGEKKFSVDYEHMHDKLSDTWNRLNVGKCLMSDSYDIATLLIALHQSNQILDRGDLTGLAAAMKRLGAHLENG